MKNFNCNINIKISEQMFGVINLIGILITSHGMMCEGILDSMKMIAGENSNIFVLKFNESYDYVNELHKQLDKMSNEYDGILILTDIRSGTPFNESYKYMNENENINMKIITGMNLPMIIELSLALEYENDLSKLVLLAVESGKESITSI